MKGCFWGHPFFRAVIQKQAKDFRISDFSCFKMQFFFSFPILSSSFSHLVIQSEAKDLGNIKYNKIEHKVFLHSK